MLPWSRWEKEWGLSDSYLGDQRLDELGQICMGLMKEIWLLRDRQVVLERLLENAGIVDRQMIERYEPTAQTEAEISAEVDRMISRVFDGAFPKGPPDLEDLTARVRREMEFDSALRALDGPGQELV